MLHLLLHEALGLNMSKLGAEVAFGTRSRGLRTICRLGGRVGRRRGLWGSVQDLGRRKVMIVGVYIPQTINDFVLFKVIKHGDGPDNVVKVLGKRTDDGHGGQLVIEVGKSEGVWG
jgi:hypothetical protein